MREPAGEESDEPVDPDVPATDERPAPALIAAVAVGGALGAPARYEMARLILVARNGFPWATFWTNVSGSLLLGFVLVVLIERFPPSRYLRALIATGFLGAYTTFSTFMVDADVLVKNAHPVTAVAYVVASTIAGFAAVWAGICAGRLGATA